MEKKPTTITIIGNEEHIKNFIENNDGWIMFSAEKSKKIPNYDVVKFFKMEDNK